MTKQEITTTFTPQVYLQHPLLIILNLKSLRERSWYDKILLILSSQTYDECKASLEDSECVRLSSKLHVSQKPLCPYKDTAPRLLGPYSLFVELRTVARPDLVIY